MSDIIYDAIIVGAGYGGLGAAARLTQAGYRNFLVLERAGEIGGVWRDNDYPGAACDTQSPIYCFGWFPHLSVSRMYAGRDELLGYLQSIVDEFELSDRIDLDSAVHRATWDERNEVWIVEDSQGRRHRARNFIPAVGQLGTPNIPQFPGQEEFEGTLFHSARWRHDIDLTDKRVASIGAAASAVQYVPEVAQRASRLVVFQRSANYILPRNQHVFTDSELASHTGVPETFLELRNTIHTEREQRFALTRHDTAEQRAGVEDARRHLENQISDPQLRRQLTPDYEFGCKRILRSDDYYPALARANVEVETSGIERFTATGVITRGGNEYELDVVILGTGFSSQTFVGEIEIVGCGGTRLDARWGDAPEAFLGMLVDGFPNLFLVYGPNTNLNHNSIVAMLEIQHDFIVAAVTRSASGGPPIEVAADQIDAFNDAMQIELSSSAYSSDCSSWYKNADGRVVNNWSGTVEEYRSAVADFTRVVEDRIDA